jgi:hypothetical protein
MYGCWIWNRYPLSSNKADWPEVVESINAGPSPILSSIFTNPLPNNLQASETAIFNSSLKLPANPFTMHFPTILLPLSLALFSSANPIANPAPALEIINLDKTSTYRISLYSKPDFQGDQATFTEEYAFTCPAPDQLLTKPVVVTKYPTPAAHNPGSTPAK